MKNRAKRDEQAKRDREAAHRQWCPRFASGSRECLCKHERPLLLMRKAVASFGHELAFAILNALRYSTIAQASALHRVSQGQLSKHCMNWLAENTDQDFQNLYDFVSPMMSEQEGGAS